MFQAQKVFFEHIVEFSVSLDKTSEITVKNQITEARQRKRTTQLTFLNSEISLGLLRHRPISLRGRRMRNI